MDQIPAGAEHVRNSDEYLFRPEFFSEEDELAFEADLIDLEVSENELVWEADLVPESELVEVGSTSDECPDDRGIRVLDEVDSTSDEYPDDRGIWVGSTRGEEAAGGDGRTSPDEGIGPRRHGPRLCCYHLQHRCKFRGGACWFSHAAASDPEPWLTRACQFGEDCLRGHWAGLVSNVLSRAALGAAARVFAAPVLRDLVCGFLRPRLLPADVAPAVRRRPRKSAAAARSAESDRAAPESTDPVAIAIRGCVEGGDLARMTIQDVMQHLSTTFGEPTAEMQAAWRTTIAAVAHERLARQERARDDAASPHLLTVADIKEWIADQVYDAEDECGLHLDGTLECLEEEVAGDVGAQDDATRSRWRQWVMEESARREVWVCM